jgi:hypothetical protein
MLTEARIREDLRPAEGLSWVTALRAPAIKGLVERGELQLSIFDKTDLGEITSTEYPLGLLETKEYVFNLESPAVSVGQGSLGAS